MSKIHISHLKKKKKTLLRVIFDKAIKHILAQHPNAKKESPPNAPSISRRHGQTLNLNITQHVVGDRLWIRSHKHSKMNLTN